VETNSNADAHASDKRDQNTKFKTRFFAALRMTTKWIPAPAFTGVTTLRRNDSKKYQIRHKRTFGIEQGMPK